MAFMYFAHVHVQGCFLLLVGSAFSSRLVQGCVSNENCSFLLSTTLMPLRLLTFGSTTPDPATLATPRGIFFGPLSRSILAAMEFLSRLFSNPRKELYEAAERGDVKGMEAALMKDATAINWPNPSYLACTPLHLAVEYGHKEAVKYLLSKGADPNKQNVVGSGSLHFVSVSGDEQRDLQAALANMLMQAGANVNLADGSGWTPLHWAAYYGHVDVVQALMSSGADISFENDEGHTPLYVARRHGHSAVASVLQAHRPQKLG